MTVIDALRKAVHAQQPVTITVDGVTAPVMLTNYEIACRAPWVKDHDDAFVPASVTIKVSMEPARAA